MAQDIKAYVEQLARAAKEASRPLGFASDEARQTAVRAMATALRENASRILDANARDMTAAREAGTNEGLLDRLLGEGFDPVGDKALGGDLFKSCNANHV